MIGPINENTRNKYCFPKETSIKLSHNLERSTNRSPMTFNRNPDLTFNSRSNLKSELISSSSSFAASVNKMGVYNELAKKLKSNKSHWTETETKNSDKKSRKSSPDLKSFLKVKSYNKSFSNFDNLLCSGNSTTTNFNKTKTRIISAGTKGSDLENNKDLSMSWNNLKISAQKISSQDIEGPEELHFFNVGICQNNKKLAYKFEHFDPLEDLN